MYELFTQFLESISNLRNLEWFWTKYNHLETFPERSRKPSSLESLNVYGKQLIYLLKSIVTLCKLNEIQLYEGMEKEQSDQDLHVAFLQAGAFSQRYKSEILGI
ncbi:MAG: hypothetical protein BAJALOKI1v1_1130009 [Promethearchaeota archaeon]|nr:MAG: hypothetical protein BAJALOKI1v1_1130009 [Candidatus Lokiarchaeota archaeon]